MLDDRADEKKTGFILTERDRKMLREINRWKCPLGRHIQRLADFTGARATDRRLKKLIDAGYLERKHYIYGIPGIYFVTAKAKGAIGIRYYKYSIRLDEIAHDISVLDTAIYVHEVLGVTYTDILSERELHSVDGFSNRKHQPDFVYMKDGKKHAVEIELTPKSKQRFEANLKSNYKEYDSQLWVVPANGHKIKGMLEHSMQMYPDVEMLSLETIEEHMKKDV